MYLNVKVVKTVLTGEVALDIKGTCNTLHPGLMVQAANRGFKYCTPDSDRLKYYKDATKRTKYYS